MTEANVVEAYEAETPQAPSNRNELLMVILRMAMGLVFNYMMKTLKERRREKKIAHKTERKVLRKAERRSKKRGKSDGEAPTPKKAKKKSRKFRKLILLAGLVAAGAVAAKSIKKGSWPGAI